MVKYTRKGCSESRPEQFDVKNNGKPYSMCKQLYNKEKMKQYNAKKNPRHNAKNNPRNNAQNNPRNSAKTARRLREKNIQLMMAAGDEGLDEILTKEQLTGIVALFSKSIEQALESNPDAAVHVFGAGGEDPDMLAEGFASFGRANPLLSQEGKQSIPRRDFESKFGKKNVLCQLLYKSNNAQNVDDVEKAVHQAHKDLAIGTRLWRHAGKGSWLSSRRIPRGRVRPFLTLWAS